MKKLSMNKKGGLMESQIGKLLFILVTLIVIIGLIYLFKDKFTDLVGDITTIFRFGA